jgi:tetratricopeptide (TPR) repeat protein
VAQGQSTGNGPDLVGRAREFEQLDAALADAFAGRGALALLTGEPGIGKTTLARSFVEHASTRDAMWAWGACWDGGGAPAYWPWVQIVRSLVRRRDAAALRDELGDSAPWIAGLLPELADTLGTPPPPSDLDPEQARFRLFDALAGLLAVVAKRRPLVLVLDDLHWADASSLYALEFVARMLADAPVLAIAAYRHTEAHARDDLSAPLGGLARMAMRLPLEGLSRDDVEQMARIRARGLGPDDPELIPSTLVEALHRASAGNPFFVDELVQLLISQGRLRDLDAGRRPLPLPGGVRDALRRRLAPFDEPTMDALGAAAVIGGEFRLATLASILDSSAATVLEQLYGPLRAGLVTTESDPGRLAFVHALVRETLLEGLGTTRRVRLHRIAGETLERLYRDDPEPRLAEIAHHFLQAATEGGAERAVDYAARAAQRAVEQFSYEEAARLYERAIEVAETLAADEERAWQLRQSLGETLMRAGDSVAARRSLGVAATHARRLSDPQRLAQSALASTLGGFSPGVVEPELVALLEEALAEMDPVSADDPAGQAADDDLRCRLRVQLALALYWSPQRERRERLVDEALTLARATFAGEAAQASLAQRRAADRTLAFALAQGFAAVWGPDTIARGLPISLEVLELCERTGDAELGLQVRLWRISLLLELDDPLLAEEEIEAFGAIARRLGQPRMLVFDPLHRAMEAHLRGDFVAAERFTAQALAQSRDVRGSIGPIIADAQTFLVRRSQGRHLDLEPLVRETAGRLPAMRLWRCGLALVLADLGREEEARRELEHLAAADFEDIPRDALWLVAMSALAQLCALLGDARRAQRLYELLISYEGRNVVFLGAAYLGPVAHYLGLLAMTTGDDERALAHLETARAAAERMGARPTVVLTALDAAEVLARRGAAGDAQRGRALAERVAHDATQQQMNGALARIAQLRKRFDSLEGASARRPQRATLTREHDVWSLGYGKRNFCLQDVKGMRHLATLLAQPDTRVTAVALAAAAEQDAGDPAATILPAAGPPAMYRERAADLREELAEAQAFNDPERVALAQQQLETLATELTTEPSLKGAAGERARINVTRSIRAAVRRIAEHHAELGALLQREVRTGALCSYEPDPDTPLDWEIRF